MLDVRRLQMLQAVAREGSLSAAARTLGYTQPAVSHHIARLEEEMGTPLITRLGRGVRLTDAGLALADHAGAVLNRLAAAEEEVASIAGLRAGRVRLAAFPSGSATLVPAALARLRAAHPAVAVSFVEAEPDESVPLLRAGEVDLVLGFEYEAVGDEDSATDYEKVPLLFDPLQAVLPRDHPLAGAEEIALGELAGATWIAGCERCRGHLMHACERAGFAPEIAYATDDYVTVQALIAAGLGVALLPSIVLSAVRRDDVVVLPVAERPGRTVQVVLPAAGRRPPAVDAMLAALDAASIALAGAPEAARYRISASPGRPGSASGSRRTSSAAARSRPGRRRSAP